MIFVVNLRVPVYGDVRSPYVSSTPINQRTHPCQNASHTGVGEAEPADIWDDCWVCTVLEVGITSTNWLDLTEADVPVDALCRKHNTTTVQELGARRTQLQETAAVRALSDTTATRGPSTRVDLERTKMSRAANHAMPA